MIVLYCEGACQRVEPTSGDDAYLKGYKNRIFKTGLLDLPPDVLTGPGPRREGRASEGLTIDCPLMGGSLPHSIARPLGRSAAAAQSGDVGKLGVKVIVAVADAGAARAHVQLSVLRPSPPRRWNHNTPHHHRRRRRRRDATGICC